MDELINIHCVGHDASKLSAQEIDECLFDSTWHLTEDITKCLGHFMHYVMIHETESRELAKLKNSLEKEVAK